MFRKLKLDARRVYLFMEIAFTICFCLFDTASSLYLVTIARLAPLQLVLVGTTTEVFGFLFEVPTGVVADVYSRRLSIIIGYGLVGLGLFVEGLFPAYLPILLATVLFSIGSTFLSGAKEAWITDEIGEESANQLFLRVGRYGAFAWLTGLALTLLIGANNVVWPLLASGIGIVFIALVLMVIMPETGFHPTPKEDRNTFQHMGHIFNEGVKAVRARPRLINVVFIALFYGLYSEGFDRLSVKLLLDNFHVPVFFGSNQVSFLVMLEAIGAVCSMFVFRFVEKRLDTSNPAAIGRAMLLVTALITVAMVSFALSPVLVIAVIAMLSVNLLRGIRGVLQTTWINQKLDSPVRATIHSMFAQVDAVGQITSGPAVGLIANALSVRLAVAISGTLLSPALFFIRRANAQDSLEPNLSTAEPAD